MSARKRAPAEQLPERALTAKEIAHLNEVADREQPREWYLVTRRVYFNPPQTIAEVRARYPGCGVRPMEER